MSNRSLCSLVALCTMALPSIALAHPGHGTLTPEGVLHYLVDHPIVSLAGLLAMGVVGALASRHFIRRS